MGGMKAGVPGLLALGGTAIAATVVYVASQICLPTNEQWTSQETLARRACFGFSSATMVAVVFWVWAIINTVHNGGDLGTVTFLLVMASGAFGMYTAWNGDHKSATRSRACAVTSSVIV